MKPFALKTGAVEIDGVTFDLREPTHAEFVEFGEILAKDRSQATRFLIATCVKAGGEAITPDDVQTLPARVTRTILPAVEKLAGFEKEKDSRESDAD